MHPSLLSKISLSDLVQQWVCSSICVRTLGHIQSVDCTPDRSSCIASRSGLGPVGLGQNSTSCSYGYPLVPALQLGSTLASFAWSNCSRVSNDGFITLVISSLQLWPASCVESLTSSCLFSFSCVCSSLLPLPLFPCAASLRRSNILEMLLRFVVPSCLYARNKAKPVQGLCSVLQALSRRVWHASCDKDASDV